MVALFVGYNLVHGQPLYPKTVLLNLTFVFNLVPGKFDSLIYAGWTIGVEMLFYALFLPIYRVRLAFQVVVTVAALVAYQAALMWLPARYAWFTFVGFLPLFVFGMWTFAIYDRLRDGKGRRLGWPFLALGVVTLVACAAPALAEKDVYLRFPIGLGYCLVLLGCGLLEPALLARKVFTFYGRISYSLYLVHSIVIAAMFPLFPGIDSALPPGIGYWLGAAASLILSTACAYVLYRWVELPGMRLGVRVFERIDNAKPQPVPLR